MIPPPLNLRTGQAKPPTTLPVRATVAALVAAMLASTGHIHAASATYTGTVGDGVFDTGGNWSTGTAPGDTTAGVTTNPDVATFNTTPGVALTLSAQRNLGGITYGAATGSTVGTFTLGTTAGPAFLLSSGGTIIANSTSGSQTINAPLIFQNAAAANAGTYTIQTDAASSNRVLTFGGAISGAATAGGVTTLTLAGGNAAINLFNGAITDGGAGGKLGLIKNGTTTYGFGTANTFSGGVTLNAGTLRSTSAVNSTTNFGTGAITFTGGGGTLAFASTGAATVNNDLVINGTSNFINAKAAVLAPATMTGTGTLALTANGSNVVFSYTNVGNFAGTLEIGNSVSFRATATASNSALTNTNILIDSGGALTENIGTNGAATVTIGSLAGAGTIGASAAGTGLFTYTLGGNNASTVFSGTIVNGSTVSALTKTGTGTMTLSGGNTYTGATMISAGTLQIGNGGTTGTLSTSSTITNNATLAFNRTNTVAQGTDFTATAISGSGGLTQAGSGTLTLTAANTYSGTTLVSAGTLLLNSTGSINNSLSVQVTAGALTLQNATALADTGDLNFASGTALNLDATGAVTETIGSLTLNTVPVAPGTYSAATLTTLYGASGVTFEGATEMLMVTTLATVPEPGTWMAGMLLVVAAGFHQRRRVKGLLAANLA